MTAPSDTTQIFAHRLLVTPDRAGAAYNRWIEIRDGTISDMHEGQAEGSPPLFAMPALANAHDHGRGLSRLAYGALDDALEIWLAAASALHPPVDPYLLAATAFSRMARSGVAGTVHCHMPQRFDRLMDEAQAVCRAVQDVGLRMAFVVPMVDRHRLAYCDDEKILALLGEADREELRARWAGPLPSADAQIAMVDEIARQCESASVDVQFGPFGLEWASDELLCRVAEASADTGRRVHMHCQETHRQRAWADDRFPGGFAAHLDDLGLLSPRLTLAHCVWLRPDECDLLAERGVTIAVNSSSNLRLGSGIAPAAEFARRGVRLAVGVDSLSIDDDDDALRELRLFYRLHRGNSLDPGLSAADVLNAATSSGFRAIDGSERDGTIGVGAPADLILFDWDLLGGDVVSSRTSEVDILLGRATRDHISSVWSSGREIVRNGRVLGLDEAAAVDELHAQAAAGANAANAFIPTLERYRAALRQFYGQEGQLESGG
ncbi:MAG: amidohydrolase family protein [Rhodospirillaceae bacterium]|nr:amidohydrolase family protein [Rhodospirillaceae bacterium]